MNYCTNLHTQHSHSNTQYELLYIHTVVYTSIYTVRSIFIYMYLEFLDGLELARSGSSSLPTTFTTRHIVEVCGCAHIVCVVCVKEECVCVDIMGVCIYAMVKK